MPTLAEEVDAKFKRLFDTFCTDKSIEHQQCPNMELWLKEFFRAGYREGYVAFREKLGEG
jgi:hypothetical protein